MSHTAHYAVLGHPVFHSLSPKIHNSSFKILGIDADYIAVDADESNLREVVENLVSKGFSGWNITMPDKTLMSQICDEISEESRIARSVNTVINKNGKLYGTTTDGQGFIFALSELGISLKGQKLTMFGAGGAASAMLISSVLEGASAISVFCRSASSKDRISGIAGALSSHPTSIAIYDSSDTAALSREIHESIAVANCSNVGMAPQVEETPIDKSCLFSGCAVYDAIYNPFETRLLREAGEIGCLTANGLSMLVGQAAYSFKLWTGQDMPVHSLPPLV